MGYFSFCIECMYGNVESVEQLPQVMGLYGRRMVKFEKWIEDFVVVV